jgi:membrane-bound ClpP family serine protease
MAIAALILGIASLVFAFIPGINIVGVIIGVVGIILGAIAMKKLKEAKQPNGMAKAGLIMSIAGVALGLILWISCMVCASAYSKAIQSELSKNPKLQDDLKGELEKATKELEKAAKEAEKAK